MIGMKENLIDMMGTVFANRREEALAKARKVPEYETEEKKVNEIFDKLFKMDKEIAHALDDAAVSLLNIITAEAYYLGLQDGFTLVQLLTQKELPFTTLEQEAVKKVEASIPQNDPFMLRPYGF